MGQVRWQTCVKTQEKTQLRQQLRQQPIRQHATHKIIDPEEFEAKTAAAKEAAEIRRCNRSLNRSEKPRIVQ